MKLHALTKSILLASSLTLLAACGGSNKTSKQNNHMADNTKAPTSQAVTLRNSADEIAFMRTKANFMQKNAQGYWEADFGNGLVFVYVPKGRFAMGNNALSEDVTTDTYPATPVHTVNLDHYWIAKTPITIGQFRAFVQATHYVTDVEKPASNGPWVYDIKSGEGFMPKKGYYWDNAFKDILAAYPEISIDDNHPVSCVSWNDAIAYTNWLAKQKGITVTLPTEAEWEYAARGNDGRVYPWGDSPPDGTKANYADNTFKKYFPNLKQSYVHEGVTDGFAITSPVGSFPKGASAVGAMDMAGNLTEWVYDSEYDYTTAPQHNPIYTDNNSIKMQKGGFWAGSAGRAGQNPNELAFGHNIRSDARQGDDPASADDHLGFRVAISYTARQ